MKRGGFFLRAPGVDIYQPGVIKKLLIKYYLSFFDPGVTPAFGCNEFAWEDSTGARVS